MAAASTLTVQQLLESTTMQFQNIQVAYARGAALLNTREWPNQSPDP